MRLRINGSFYKFFTDLNIGLKLDSVASTFSFTARFNPNNANHREIFRPLTYPLVEIFNNENELIFTGTIVNHSFTSTKNPNLLALSGYSLPGIIEDVTVPVSAYPLENLNRSLKDIATRLLDLFNIKLVIDSTVTTEANRIYTKSVTEPTDTVKAYLSKLTSQRNIVLCHNAKGEIVMFRPDLQTPEILFTDQNTLSMKFNVNGQAMHSDVFVIRQPSANNEGVRTSDVAKNPQITLFRPITKILSSGEDTDTQNAADNQLANELKSITLTISLENPIAIIPGAVVEVINPEIFLFERTRFMVREYKIKENSKEDISELVLVLPETFNAKPPPIIF